MYPPLRLAGRSTWTAADCDRAFVLHSPNKALGLTGIRGAYAVAPGTAGYDVPAWCRALEAAAPSWPLSAQADALLRGWAGRDVQQWVADSHATLAHWKALLQQELGARGFTQRASSTPYRCVRPPLAIEPRRLRRHGVAVRDAASFGLPGWWRVSAQPPRAARALLQAIDLEVGGRP
ncbi:aminotransferase class I/II-fold pyridoxal phosphate-dependent enzyme [Piscinibacter koreensis]|uniref:aminotransferase class I/II-fold pyridoxal phosphate-dependent enzyme n=1 Tax=Piscinibacter koreensis TaxID=2742824 RepID=UPI003158B37A